MTRSELAVRMAIVVLALASVLVDAPSPVTVVLGLASLANTGTLASRVVPTNDPVTRCLIALMALPVLLILLGLTLNQLSGGLTTQNWAIGWALISATALLLVWLRLAAEPAPKLSGAMSLSLAVFVLGVVAAFAIANAGVNRENNQPSLELSAPRHDLNSALVEVRARGFAVSYELRVLPDGREAADGSPQAVTVRGEDVTTTVLRVSLPRADRSWTLVLRSSGPRRVERRVILVKEGSTA